MLAVIVLLLACCESTEHNIDELEFLLALRRGLFFLTSSRHVRVFGNENEGSSVVKRRICRMYWRVHYCTVLSDGSSDCTTTECIYFIDTSSVCRTLYVPVHCMQSYHGALERSSYPLSKYMKFVVDVDLASSLLHKSRRRFQTMRLDKHTKPTPTHPRRTCGAQ